jgi:hypothetical protein
MRRTALLLLAACGGDYVAADDFSYSDEEWTLEAHNSDPTMRLAEDVTYDGPALCGSDNGFSGATDFWRFNAPKKYLGNASRAYGRRLTWDSQTVEGRGFAANDLFLNGRGISLVLRVPNTANRASSWASFAVHLDTKSDWRVLETNAVATEDDLKSTLGTLTSVRLPGEWRDGPETTCIDNVYFGTL